MTTRPLMTVAMCIGLTSPAWGDLIFVPGDYGTIQAGINAASAGDQVLVSAGTYNEAINFNGKAITLRALSGAGSTTIDSTGLSSSTVTCSSGEGSSTVLDGFTVTGGVGTPFGPDRLGGGMYNQHTSPTVRNCVFRDNVADAGGGMMNFTASPTVENCSFIDNMAEFGAITAGGGGMMNNGGSAQVIGCIFRGNEAANWGGGMNNMGASPLIVNTCFVDNEAAGGGGLRNALSTPEIVNCTISNNVAQSGSGIRNSSNGSANPIDITNTILWGNYEEEIVDLAGSQSIVSYSIVEGGWPGATNIDVEPMFVDAASGDYHLQEGSPCIDAGDDTAIPAGVTTDMEGNDRIYGSAVDMGVYEPQIDASIPCPGDLNDDGLVDFTDLIDLLFSWGDCVDCSEDVDGDGDVDFDDLLQLLTSWGTCP